MFQIKMFKCQINKVCNIRHKNHRRFMPLTAAAQMDLEMEHNQNMIAAINHQCTTRIKFHDHSGLFHQSLKKLVSAERLLGTCCGGRCREVVFVERFRQESMYGLSARTKKATVVERFPLVEVRIYYP